MQTFNGFKFNQKPTQEVNEPNKVLKLRNPDNIVHEHLHYILNAQTEQELHDMLFDFYHDVEENTIKHELMDQIEDIHNRLEDYLEEPCECDGCCAGE